MKLKELIGEMTWTPAVFALILMNMIPIAGVIAFGWNAGVLIFLYWLENVVIGALNIPKLLSARGADDGSQATGIFSVGAGLFLVSFFTVHYGMFCFGHYSFLESMFPGVPSLTEIFERKDIMIALAGLTFSHVISMFVNFYGKGEYKTRSPGTQMFLPYTRIVVLHVVIIFGGFFAMVTNSGFIPLILLVGLKTVVDLGRISPSTIWRRRNWKASPS